MKRFLTLAAFALSTAALLSPAKSLAGMIYAQKIVDEEAAKHPELNILSIHAIPAGAMSSSIIASTNKSKVGKQSDPDDLQVMMSKQPEVESKDDRNVTDIGVPLYDNQDHVIGMLVMEVKYSFTKDKDAALKDATKIADDLKARLGSQKRLFDDPSKTIYAQKIIDAMAAKHPELNILSFHAVKPGDTQSYIIASSNRNKVGKTSDPDDYDAVKKPDAELRDDKKIVDLGMALLDSSGKVIGILVTEVKYSYTKDKDVALKHGMEIRDELAKQISSVDQLFEDASG